MAARRQFGHRPTHSGARIDPHLVEAGIIDRAIEDHRRYGGARQALKRTLLNLQEARWEGEVNDSLTGRKTHEDHFGIIDRVLWPVVNDGRLERLGYIFLGSWFLEQLRHEATDTAGASLVVTARV